MVGVGQSRRVVDKVVGLCYAAEDARLVERLLEDVAARYAAPPFGRPIHGVVRVLQVAFRISQQDAPGAGRVFLVAGDRIGPGRVVEACEVPAVLPGEDDVVVGRARVDGPAERTLVVSIVNRPECDLALVALIPLVMLPASRRKYHRVVDGLVGLGDDLGYDLVLRPLALVS